MPKKPFEKKIHDPNIQIRGQDTVLHFKDAISAYEHFCSQDDAMAMELKAMPHKFVAIALMSRFQELQVPPRIAAKYAGELTDFMHYICHRVAQGDITVYHTAKQYQKPEKEE